MSLARIAAGVASATAVAMAAAYAGHTATLSADERDWYPLVVVVVATIGASLLSVGTLLWRSHEARAMRVAGTVAAASAALLGVSFAWILLPLIVLAALSFRHAT